MKKYIKIGLIIGTMLFCLEPIKTDAKNFDQNSEIVKQTVIEKTADEEIAYQVGENKKLVKKYNGLINNYIKACNKLKKYDKKRKFKQYNKRKFIKNDMFEDNNNNIQTRIINKKIIIGNISAENRLIKKDISKIKKEIKKINKKASTLKRKKLKKQTKNPNWKGGVLTKSKGVNMGPCGKETYYNLNMSNIVKIMKSKGFKGDYWIRDDGCKMFGDYIMVAANFKKYPRGTIVETSLGKGIVCDTGGFVHNGSGITFDIAINW